MNELQKLLRIRPGPATDGMVFAHIKCEVDFEPHGLASENWEVIWYLTLPQIPHHWWHCRNGWTRGTTDSPIRFSGRTMDGVIKKAISFLQEYVPIDTVDSAGDDGILHRNSNE